ncbi:mitochondrial ornithine transporter 1-like [Polymixia lowei]
MEDEGFEKKCGLHPVISAIVDLSAGAAGGVACVLSGQPCDTVKVKLQTFPDVYRGAIDCFVRTWKKSGLRGLYQGTGAALLAHAGENAILFTCYGGCQRIVRHTLGMDSLQEMSPLHNALSGSLASVFSSLVLCPTELVKCRLQADNEMRMLGRTSMDPGGSSWSVVRSVLRSEGPLGLLQGLTSTWLREVPGYFFFFGGYEVCRSLLTPREGDQLDVVSLLVSGGVGGAAFWLAVYPIDSVKSRIQVQSVAGRQSGFTSTLLQIVRTEGVPALYRGLTPTVLRAFPSNGALFLAYEWTRRFLGNAASAHITPPD